MELSPQDRAAFLDDACRSDDELKREVDLLLEQDACHGLLDDPAWDVKDRTARLAPGDIVGSYRIQSCLGAGAWAQCISPGTLVWTGR
jgi:hypothetical protein